MKTVLRSRILGRTTVLTVAVLFVGFSSVQSQGVDAQVVTTVAWPPTSVQSTGSIKVPWSVTIHPSANTVAIGSCPAVYIDLLDQTGKDVARNPIGQLVSMADFDWSTASNAAVGKYDGPNAWAVCACPSAVVGTTITVMASYPAALLPDKAKVPGLAFRSFIELPVAPARGDYSPPGCEKFISSAPAAGGTNGNSAIGSNSGVAVVPPGLPSSLATAPANNQPRNSASTVQGGTQPAALGAASVVPPARAGGDLGGLYPNPTVVGLGGRPLANAAPEVGDVMKWNGKAWQPGKELAAHTSVQQFNLSTAIQLDRANVDTASLPGLSNQPLILARSSTVVIHVFLLVTLLGNHPSQPYVKVAVTQSFSPVDLEVARCVPSAGDFNMTFSCIGMTYLPAGSYRTHVYLAKPPSTVNSSSRPEAETGTVLIEVFPDF